MDDAAIRLMEGLSEAYRAHAVRAPESKAEKICNRGTGAIVALWASSMMQKGASLWEDELPAAAVQNILDVHRARDWRDTGPPRSFWPIHWGGDFGTRQRGAEQGLFTWIPGGGWPTKGHRKPLEYVTEWITE